MHRLRASHIYLILRGMTSLASVVMFTVYTTYYVQTLGLNPLQLVLVGTVLETTVLLFEIPTGVVADSYSRRLSVIIGILVLGMSYLINGALPLLAPWLQRRGLSLFAALLFGEAVVGIGWTFISGALSAWIADEVGESQVGPLFLRANQIGQLISLIGIPLSVGLASISLNIPYLVGGFIYLALGVFLLAVMKETNYAPAPPEGRSLWRVMGDTWRQSVAVVRGRPILMMIIGVGLFSGAASEGFDRLWQAYFLDAFTFPSLGKLQPVVWFGVIAAIRSILSIIMTQSIGRKIKTSDQHAVMWAMTLLTAVRIGCLISFALAGNFMWALVSYVGISVAATLIEPLFEIWINHNVDSAVRATVISMTGQADALGQTAGGPVVGWMGMRSSLRISMLFVAVLLAPSLGAYTMAIRNHIQARPSTRQ